MEKFSRDRQGARRRPGGGEEHFFLRMCSMSITAAVALMIIPGICCAADGGSFFGIHIVDEATGRGVPMAELEAGDQERRTTDSAGWVALTSRA